MKAKKPLRKNKSKARQTEKRARAKRVLGLAAKTAGSFLAVLLMVLLFVFVHDLVTQWDHFNAQTIEITGNRHLTEKQVLALAGIKPTQNILSVNLGLARKRLISHGWIADAAVNRILPAGLGINIREHAPAAFIDLDPGFIMDDHGIVFKKAAPGETADLPVVSGLAYEDITACEGPGTPAMRAVVNLLTMGRGPASAVLGKQLKKISVDRETGLTLTVDGRFETVKIGYGRYPEKLNLLSVIGQFAGRSATFETIETIDLNNTSRVVLGPVAPGKRQANNKEV